MQSLQPRGYVDTIAVDVVLLDDHVTEVDADPKRDALVLGRFLVPVDHTALDLDRAAYRVDDTGELRQKPVAGVLDDPAVMLGNLGINQFAEMCLEAFVRALLIGAHQARVARHICGKDRGKAAGRGHG